MKWKLKQQKQCLVIYRLRSAKIKAPIIIKIWMFPNNFESQNFFKTYITVKFRNSKIMKNPEKCPTCP